MSFEEVMAVIKAFFDAIAKIFSSLGITLPGMTEETTAKAE